MKLFTLLFGFYMLLLSGLPCSDADECGQTTDQISTTSDNKDQHREKDNCTPFCNCACCAAPVAIRQPFVYKLSKPVLLAKKYPVININFTSFNLSAIWQPPRLS
jgi:hypothetical protein